jgi:hypothetical protein
MNGRFDHSDRVQEVLKDYPSGGIWKMRLRPGTDRRMLPVSVPYPSQGEKGEALWMV